MIYTKQRFVQELKQKLQAGYDLSSLAQWAYLVSIDEYGELEESLDTVVSKIAVMSLDPQFEISEEELWKFANELDASE